MDLQSKKLEVIQACAASMNEGLIDRVRQLFLEAQKEELEKELFKPLTKEDIVNRALEAEEDYKNGRLTSLDDLMNEKW